MFKYSRTEFNKKKNRYERVYSYTKEDPSIAEDRVFDPIHVMKIEKVMGRKIQRKELIACLGKREQADFPVKSRWSGRIWYEKVKMYSYPNDLMNPVDLISVSQIKENGSIKQLMSDAEAAEIMATGSKKKRYKRGSLKRTKYKMMFDPNNWAMRGAFEK